MRGLRDGAVLAGTLVLGGLGALGCAGEGTDPVVRGHPEGTLVASPRLGGRPFGVAVGDISGRVYVSRLDAAELSWGTLPGTTLEGKVAVGSVPTGVAFAPGEATAYVTNQFSRTIGVVDANSNMQLGEIPIAGDPFVVLVSGDGGTVYATANNNFVYVVDAASRRATDSVAVGDGPNGLVLHPFQPRLYVSSIAGEIAEIETGSKAKLRTFPIGGRPQGLAVSRDGAELYVANEVGPLYVVSTATGFKADSVAEAGGGFDVALSPDDEVLYVGVPAAGKVVMVERTTRSVLGGITTGGTPRRVAFDLIGSTAVIANEGGWADFIR